MKATMIAIAMMMAGTAAKADGFVCTTESGIVVRVYNSTDASVGTRSGAVMILSDSSVGAGNKTIAKFSAEKKTLSSHKLTYLADVDLRVTESSRKGELIGGTKLGYIDQMILTVDFTYAAPVADGTPLSGQFSIEKRNGEVLIEEANCVRYLKN